MQAEPIAVTAGITANFLTGKHDTGNGIDKLNLVPLPLAEVDGRYQRTTLHIEALPGVTFGYDDGLGGTQYTRLSIVNVVLRQSVRGGVFVGAGQTVYNQRTDYGVAHSPFVANQASRVTGARFEVGYGRRILGRGRLECVAAINPIMHGVERTELRPFFRYGRAIVSGERAVQVDTALRLSRPLGPGELLYGIRYLNYASRYDVQGRRDDRSLADRNVGIMPLLGYRLRL